MNKPSAVSDTLLVSFNPATGEELGTAPIATRDEVFEAVRIARSAASSWSRTSFGERGAYILKARKEMLGRLDDIASLVSRETGKPRVEAVSCEILPIADLMSFFAKRAGALLRPERVPLGKFNWIGRSSWLVYKPLGVIGIISPWNFPLSIPLGAVTMALMAGNAVVLKPSEFTPLVGMEIGRLFDSIGLPQGLLTVLTGDGSTGSALCEAEVNKIVFTGSVATGKKVMAAAAQNLTPVVLELGGKDAMVVLEDADIEVAASGAVWGAFCNSGQICAAVERCYVHQSIAQQFIQSVVRKTQLLRQGPDNRFDVDVGAMTNERQLAIVERHVEDAVSRGARILCGGKRKLDKGGLFFAPTVLTEVDHTFAVLREETFGPILPIMIFHDDEEAVTLANDSRYGLTASVWTKDLARGRRLAELIEAGTVAINDCVYTHAIPQAPWGGIKQSGMGYTHSRLGLRELVVTEHIHINRLRRLRDFWWYGYSETTYRVLGSLASTFTSTSWWEKARSLPALLRAQRLPKY